MPQGNTQSWPKPKVRQGRPNTRPEQDQYVKPNDIFGEIFREVIVEVHGFAAGRRGFDLGYGDIEAFAGSRLWITDKQARLVPMVLNGVQRRVMQIKRETVAAGKPAKFLILKYRRGGISTLEQALSYQMIVQNHNAQVVTLAHTSTDTGRLFAIPLLMHRKDEQAPASPKRGNRHELKFPALNSSFYCGTAGASGFGRGQTLHRVHGSEVSRWHERSGGRQFELQEEIMAGLTEAASHGEITLETTPKGEEWFSSTYRDAKRGLNDWTPIFLPWFVDDDNRIALTPEEEEEVRETLADDELALVAAHKLTFAQIAWRRSKKRGSRLFPQEYPEDDESCFMRSGTSFFDAEKVIVLLKATDDDNRKHVPAGYYVEWEAPQEGVQYVLGSDTSEGLPGCDYNGYGVMRKDTGAQVASLHGLFKPKQLAERIYQAHLRWNKALVGVERENHGHAVLLALEELGLRSKRRLYHFSKGRSGWSTNAETRPVMLDELATWIDESGPDKVRDRDLLSECLTFRLQSGGKFEADSGCHDDCVFKWAIALQMRKVRSRPLEVW